ncbi:MAG: hypothetical protein JWO31_807 [Phycisphaerales bacterium]|nr:hypothetical protein [Phycisphaerales bacterium]
MAKRRTLAAAVLAGAAAVGLGLGHARPAMAAAAPPKAKEASKEDKAKADQAKALNEKNTFLDPAKATPDFAVQGEYLGELPAGPDGKPRKLGAQVASVGGGDFVAAFYPGGLPGAGADTKARAEVPGKAKDPATMADVSFAPQVAAGYTASWAGGALKVTTADGATAELKKVERTSPTMGAKPPAGALVLFDGTNVDQWEGGHVDERKLLAAGAKTKKKFQNFVLHAEFLLPFKPFGRDQDRGNSGLYLQERYEVQVLDSFGQPPVFNGTGSLYRQTPPDLNMCLPPLTWQAYDVDFTAPKFDAGGTKTKDAEITVTLNGVTVHDHRDVKAKTGAGKAEGAEPGPILLQGHGNPVFYRNIWIVEK